MAFQEHIKLEVRRLSHHSCCLCKSIGIEIHHVVPREEEGPNTLENAAPLCPSCHETYGANPKKRKMIKEARDLWYEICATRYKSDEDRISELLEEVTYIRRHLARPIIAQSVADEVIDRLRREGIIARNTGKGWHISELLGKIASFEKDYPTVDTKSVDITYKLVFQTKGDPSNDACIEFNETRDQFLTQFGSFIARNLCVLILYNLNISWLEGADELKLAELMNNLFTIMIFLLWHEDVGKGPDLISVSFEGNYFRAWHEESIKKLQSDSLLTAST